MGCVDVVIVDLKTELDFVSVRMVKWEGALYTMIRRYDMPKRTPDMAGTMQWIDGLPVQANLVLSSAQRTGSRDEGETHQNRESS